MSLYMNDFNSEFQRRFNIPVNHAQIKGEKWLISKWDIDLPKPGKGFINNMEKLWEERETKPIEIQHRWNILTNVGLNESSKRDTNDSPRNTTGVQYIQAGTGGTSEDVSATDLTTPHGSRNDIDSIGERTTVDQTSKYGAVLTDVEITAGTILNEAGLFNAVSNPSELHAYIVFDDFTLNAGERIVFQINELQRNGSS